MTLDATDRQILEILQHNARIANADIARQVGMAPSAVLERVRKLEKRGVIKGYSTHLDANAVGFGLLAFVLVRTQESMTEISTGLALSKVPGVQEVHHVAGEDCYLVKVRAANPEALGLLLRQEIGDICTVVSTRSTIVLETVKESHELSLSQITGEHDDA